MAEWYHQPLKVDLRVQFLKSLMIKFIFQTVSEEEQQREILAFYGEEEADNYRESPELVPVKPDPEALPKPMPQSQQQEKVVSATMESEQQPSRDTALTSAEVKVEPEVEKEPPLAENMGEFGIFVRY